MSNSSTPPTFESHIEYTSKWYCESERNELVADLVEGDLIEFMRENYRHWAIFLGKEVEDEEGNVIIDTNGFVLHHSNDEQGASGLFAGSVNSISNGGEGGGMGISRDLLSDVWQTSLIRINNGFDERMPPLGQQEILYRAQFVLQTRGYQRAYCVITNNCEHFVHYIRNDCSISSQVKQGFEKVSNAVINAAVVVGGLAVALFGSRR